MSRRRRHRERWHRHKRRHKRDCKHGEHHRRGKKLHRRLFFWFGASILVTFVVMGGMMHQGQNQEVRRDRQAIAKMLANEITPVWTDKSRRDAVTTRLASMFSAPVVVRNANGSVISGDAMASCETPAHKADIRRGGDVVGQVRVCDTGLRRGRPPVFLGLVIGGLVLWGTAGFIARRLVKPLTNVADVAKQIGDGNLASRVDIGRHPPDEIRDLADAVNDMAGRIEKQMADQRQLLAAVSHEIRTPLAHMRVIAELAREGDTAKLEDLEREIGDVDTMVDQLLASSRIEFGSFQPRDLDAVDICTRALERANIDAAILDIDVDDTAMKGDPMLLSRAVGNLLENAQRHADKVTKLRLTSHGAMLRFCVEDQGPGFDKREIDRVFDSFYRGERPTKARHGSLGLGLALVRRIAEAHGGKAWAENHDGGARVSIDIPRTGPT